MSKKNQSVQSVTKPGEGVVMGVVQQRPIVGGVVAIDMTNAPVPDRRFGADVGWTDIGTDMVRIVFGQFRGTGPDLEHMVVIRVPFPGARAFLDSMNGHVIEVARSHLGRFKVADSPKVDKKAVSSQSFTLDANILLTGFSGREACLDLYHSSPHVKLAMMRGSPEFRAEPVARVILTTRLMVDIHDELHSNSARLPADGDGERSGHD